jgi:hypothetical protein
MERLYDCPTAVDSESTAHDAAFVTYIPKQKISHCLKQSVETHITLLFSQGHVSNYQISFSEEAQRLLQWPSGYVYDLLEVIGKYILVVVVGLCQVTSG